MQNIKTSVRDSFVLKIRLPYCVESKDNRTVFMCEWIIRQTHDSGKGHYDRFSKLKGVFGVWCLPIKISETLKVVLVRSDLWRTVVDGENSGLSWKEPNK